LINYLSPLAILDFNAKIIGKRRLGLPRIKGKRILGEKLKFLNKTLLITLRKMVFLKEEKQRI